MKIENPTKSIDLWHEGGSLYKYNLNASLITMGGKHYLLLNLTSNDGKNHYERLLTFPDIDQVRQW